MRLPDHLREQLKIPLGKLLVEDDTSKENILKLITSDSFIITVGDATTEKILSYGITPALQIIDGIEKREKREIPKTNIQTELECDNPAGEITQQSIETIKNALQSLPPVRIIVKGEEDLLVIPVCQYAQNNSIVMYGQPNEGLVVVTINENLKNKIQKIVDLMN